MELKGELNRAPLDCLTVTFTLKVVVLLVGFALLGESWDQLQARSSSRKKEDRRLLVECLVSLG